MPVRVFQFPTSATHVSKYNDNQRETADDKLENDVLLLSCVHILEKLSTDIQLQENVKLVFKYN
jgi:hypothetical protein